MKRTLVIILLICILFGTCLVFIRRNADTPKPDRLAAIREPGEFSIHTSALIPHEDISSMIVEDGMIFLHYDAAGLVNVYDTHGSFQYGIQFCTLPNGSGDIAYSEGMLYCYARGNVIYRFEKTTLVDVIQFHAGSPDNALFEQYAALFSHPKSHEYAGEQFYLLPEQNTVTKIDAQNQVQTILALSPQKTRGFIYD